MLIEESEVESTDHFEQAEQSPLAHTWNSAVSEAVREIVSLEVHPVAAIIDCQKTKIWVTTTDPFFSPSNVSDSPPESLPAYQAVHWDPGAQAFARMLMTMSSSSGF